MKFKSLISRFLGLACLSGMTLSCKQLPKEMEVVERRELCQYDDVSVFKNNYESLVGTQPLEWRRVNRTEFRILNYAVGGSTEVAVGQVDGGGVLANMNRWKREFELEVLKDVSGLETIEMFGGREAQVIQLKGTFQKKMAGMPMKAEGWAVTGIICDVGGGSLVTIKMMGPEAEVVDQQGNLMKFAETLRINDLQTPDERSKKDAKVEKTEGGY